MVVDDPDLHALLRLLHQDVANLAPDLVARKDVVLEVDVFLGSEHVALEGVEFFLPAGEHFNLVAGEEVRLDDGVHQARDLLALVVDACLVKVDFLVGHIAQQLVALAARNHAHTLEAAAEQQEEEHAQHRQQDEHGHPGERFHGIAVLGDDHAYQSQYGQHIQYGENDEHHIGVRDRLGKKRHRLGFMV